MRNGRVNKREQPLLSIGHFVQDFLRNVYQLDDFMLAETSFDQVSMDLDKLQLVQMTVRALHLLKQCIDVVFCLVLWQVENILQRKETA